MSVLFLRSKKGPGGWQNSPPCFLTPSFANFPPRNSEKQAEGENSKPCSCTKPNEIKPSAEACGTCLCDRETKTFSLDPTRLHLGGRGGVAAQFLLIRRSRDPHPRPLPLCILSACEEECCFHGNDHQRFLASLRTPGSAPDSRLNQGACGDS